MNITGGKFKGQKIKTVNSNDVRPTSSKIRESVFSMLLSLGFSLENKVFLDLFAGSGIMGLEALSRGASKAVFVEKNYKVYKTLKNNLVKFDTEYNLIKSDAIKFLLSSSDKFDIIFVDPPYHEGYYEKVLPKTLESLRNDGFLIIEAPSYYSTNNLCNVVKEKIYGSAKLVILSK